jgi:cation diffusion facilitator CzcD-associated flavoprotein CzcO
MVNLMLIYVLFVKGCGSDVPGHWYSLSTDLNPNWQTYYVSQPEIRAYWEGLWRKYNLDTHTTLDTTVVQALWDSENQRYTIHIENAKTKKKETVVAHAIFWAIGGFQEPLYPKDIPGREHFSGDLFHSAAWRHDVCLKQKRVGVIGNGCSAYVLFSSSTYRPLNL